MGWCRWIGAWWCWHGCSWTGGGSQVFGRVELCCGCICCGCCWAWSGGWRVSYMEPVAIMGFLPPINLSWLRAVFKRPEDRNPAFTLSKLVSVCDLAKLTCLVLHRGVVERRFLEGIIPRTYLTFPPCCWWWCWWCVVGIVAYVGQWYELWSKRISGMLSK